MVNDIYSEPQSHYDEDTGTQLTIVDSSRYDVRRKPSKRAEPSPKPYFNTRGKTSYIECYHDPIKLLNNVLRIHELGALLKLLPYMKRPLNGKLELNKRLMGITEIASVIKKTQRPTTRIIESLVTTGVMLVEREGKRNVYAINPLYHAFAGGLDTGHYTKLYQTKTRISIADVSLQAAGLLYKTLPYFHYSRYYLCANPNERSGGLIQHLTQNELARLIGEDPMVVSRSMRELISAGFIMRQSAYDNEVLRVNPEVMYRKKALDDEAIRLISEFTELKNANEWREGVVIDSDNLPF